MPSGRCRQAMPISPAARGASRRISRIGFPRMSRRSGRRFAEKDMRYLGIRRRAARAPSPRCRACPASQLTEEVGYSRLPDEYALWQRRFWEHAIRNDVDFERHVDYVHFNPVKHRLVRRARDWPYSSFHVLSGAVCHRPTGRAMSKDP